MANKIESDGSAERVAGLRGPDRSQAPTASAPEFPESPQDREKGKFRPSQFKRLTQVAVSNDDGSPISARAEELLGELLALVDSQEIKVKRDKFSTLDAVSLSNPLPAEITNRIGTAKVVATSLVPIPGIGVASAYAALDAMGTVFTIEVPASGRIMGARFFDLDDEGLGMKAWLYNANFTGTADNSPMAPSDADLLKFEAAISFSNFHDGNTGQVAAEDGLSIAYTAPEGKLYCQMQCLVGAPNIAAGQLPLIKLIIDPD